MREIRQIPLGPVRRKARSNARQLFDLHRQESREDKVEELYKDGAAALRVLAWFRSLSVVREQLGFEGLWCRKPRFWGGIVC